MMATETWRKYLTDYNEGLGVVYERLVLNDLLDRVLDKYGVRKALEAPIYGMAGVSGINSVRLAQRGCELALVEVNGERLRGVEAIWRELGLPVQLELVADPRRLPFENDTFDLAWNFAALWHVQGADELLTEMVRVSGKLVLVFMPNPLNIGYTLRKYALEKEFFTRVDERWVSMKRVKSALKEAGVRIVEEGVIDVPPWPDTCMPAGEFLRKLGIRSKRFDARFSSSSGWQWSTMDYYLGKEPATRERIDRYAFLDRAPVPWRLKLAWAHHRYVLGIKANA